MTPFPAGSGVSAVSDHRESTLNDRIYEQVKYLNDLCSRGEDFLNRVAPRPPQPVGEHPNNKIAGAGSPPMIETINQLELVAQRLQRITQEFPKIA